MKPRLQQLVMHRLRMRDTWVILFVSGFVMMNYPFLSIFAKPWLVFKIPLLYLYLQGGWFVSIAVAYLFARSVRAEADDEERR